MTKAKVFYSPGSTKLMKKFLNKEEWNVPNNWGDMPI